MDLVLKHMPLEVYAVKGSIFDQQSVDVLALFQYPGLASLPIQIRNFMKTKEFGNEQGVLIPCGGKHGDVKAVYYLDYGLTLPDQFEAERIISAMLDAVAAAGFSSVAMNGVRTSWRPEEDNIDAIRTWVMYHRDTSVKTIYLVDKRGGFNKRH